MCVVLCIVVTRVFRDTVEKNNDKATKYYHKNEADSALKRVKTVYRAYRGIRYISELRTHGILRIRVTFCVKLEQSALTIERDQTISYDSVPLSPRIFLP